MIDREKLFENFKNLNETEKEIFWYIQGGNIDFDIFMDEEKFSDRFLETFIDNNNKSFRMYDEGHPFRKVWEKITYDIYGQKTLIHFMEYGDEYKKCAKLVNKLWNMPNYHKLVCMILKAFAERDWDEYNESFCDVYGWVERAQIDIENSCYTIADRLDVEDLKVIIKFCGGE